MELTMSATKEQIQAIGERQLLDRLIAFKKEATALNADLVNAIEAAGKPYSAGILSIQREYRTFYPPAWLRAAAEYNG